jgi:hypothetical protein
VLLSLIVYILHFTPVPWIQSSLREVTNPPNCTKGREIKDRLWNNEFEACHSLDVEMKKMSGRLSEELYRWMVSEILG